ncbi:MAG: methylated-DNA--[protein]-cysteine S-methyltransferase [Turicibacter sp.]|nr:methylated-DNA--[protein]-cysteine S-methyltransferase [Turicibacter sp.]
MVKKIIDSPVGKLTITADKEAIIGLDWGKADALEQQSTPLIAECEKELAAYFAGELKIFTVPIKFKGTPFQEDVWRALTTIPYGKTVSYGFIAKQVGKPKASRAVGGANHNNPISIIVPCHRVIGTTGKLVGFGGGLDAKEYLLKLEGAIFKK